MESDESVDVVDYEAVAKEERENPCEHFEGVNVDLPRFHSFISFLLIEVCHPC